MKEVKIEKCPFCGGTEFIECKMQSYGGVYIYTGAFRNEMLYSTVCRDCGSVVRMFCRDPEKLYCKDERRK